MARLFADENFPFRVIQLLGKLGHDVLTLQEIGGANMGIPDQVVLDLAVRNGCAVITCDEEDFVFLHSHRPTHLGIVICPDDPDPQELAIRIDAVLRLIPDLSQQLVHIPAS